MTEDRKAMDPELKELVKRLRKERPDQMERAREMQKEKKSTRRKVRKALTEEPVTVPTVAREVGIETDTALWHITAMKKYGLVVEDGMDGDWPLYRLADSKEDEA